MRRTHTTASRRRHPALAALLVAVLVACAFSAWRIASRTLQGLAPGTATSQADETRDWSQAEAPNYYAVVGPANIGQTLDPGTVTYGPLDALGRATGVQACVDLPLMEEGLARERDSTADLLPSGWGTNDEVDIELPGGKTYHGYLWNRSHLLAKSLGGEEVIENLVCGTRMQNVGANVEGTEGGMAFTESLVREWLASNPNGNVQYVATPLYRGSELVCRNVVVDVLSSDASLDLEVLVFNAAKGYRIDYATGDFWG